MRQQVKEAAVKKRIIGLLRQAQDSHPNLYWKSMSERYNSGIPDFFVAYEGTVLWIEAKGSEGRLSKIQIHEAQRLNRAGIEVVEWSAEPRLIKGDNAAKSIAPNIHPIATDKISDQAMELLTIIIKGIAPCKTTKP